MDGGGNSVIIVKDKIKTDLSELEGRVNEWVTIRADQRDGGREWPYYSGKKHRIIIEKYLEADPSKGGLIDYKFFCFNGKVRFLYVIADRKMGQNAGIGIYDSMFRRLPYERADERPLERDIEAPSNYHKMVEAAEILAKGFPHVRIDLYNVALL